MMLLFLFAAQDSLPADTLSDAVHYRAHRIVYDLERNIVILNDSSYIKYQDLELFSDSAYYFVETEVLESFGRCHLRQLNDSIKGNHLKYSLETKKAAMLQGRTQIDKGYIEAEELYWVDDKTINAYDGRYTTCSDSPPHYYFAAPRMKVYLGDMVIARPVILYIQDVPVAAAPFWFVPISSRRKSGLLPFRAGSSSAYGKYVRGLAYYQVLGDYADLTLQCDAFEKKGFMPRGELVWNYSPFSSGTVMGSYIKEIDTGDERYDIAARNNSERFLLGSSFDCDVRYQSDNSYESSYAETTAIWVEREATSTATLRRSIGGLHQSVTLQRTENFTDSTVTMMLPHYTLTTPSQLLASLVSYSVTGHANRDVADSAGSRTEHSGANIQTSPTLTTRLLGFLTVSPGFVLDAAVFDRDTMGNAYPTRLAYSFKTTANTNLYRILGIRALGINGILHAVTPRAAFTYTPEFSFAPAPAVVGIAAFAHTERIEFGLRQDFKAKIGEDQKKASLALVDVGSSYDLITDSLSKVSWSVSLPYNPLPKPITGFDTRIDGTYDVYHRAHTYRIAHGLRFQTSFLSFSLNQSYSNEGTYQAATSGELKPSSNWTVGYSARYDWEKRALVDYSLRLTRNLHCWEGEFSFNQLGDDWRYDFKVWIKEIPEVMIGRGLLGYLLE